MDQRTTQAELLFHPARKLAGRALGKQRQAGGLDQPGDSCIAFACALPKKTAKKFNVLTGPSDPYTGSCQALGDIGNLGAAPVAVAIAGHYRQGLTTRSVISGPRKKRRGRDFPPRRGQ